MKEKAYLDDGTSSEQPGAWVSISGNEPEKAGSNKVSLEMFIIMNAIDNSVAQTFIQYLFTCQAQYQSCV